MINVYWPVYYTVYRSAMATEREDDVSDGQESETDDCDTEEDEGKINFFIFFLFVCLLL